MLTKFMPLAVHMLFLILTLRYASPLILSTLSGSIGVVSKDTSVAQHSISRNKRFQLILKLPIFSFVLLYLMTIVNKTYNIQLLMICSQRMEIKKKEARRNEYCRMFDIKYMISYLWTDKVHFY
ncbi:ATV_HP_G0015000.mRNA.1.CDS.1 [Saccharomyces cerevisiae]|nr:ATV_HP_G0015000.mRNA.1.CDS.1 [Saccharomyces cerevisiae]CAI6949966.1 ATV_HP_G0015000.mRNA.1.CDS.1 [Saccharomyces cerevisiae]